MYNLMRSVCITETLCLRNKDNTVAEEIKLLVDVDTIAADFITKQDTLLAARKSLKAAQKRGNERGFAQAYELYASAIVDFFEVVFGKENTCKILEFYDGRYVEMLMQVLPFINESFVPAVYRSIEYRKKQLKKLRRGKNR